MNTKKCNKNNPTPIRLKELKAPLQEEAMKQDRSLNWLMIKIAKDFLNTLKTNNA